MKLLIIIGTLLILLLVGVPIGFGFALAGSAGAAAAGLLQVRSPVHRTSRSQPFLCSRSRSSSSPAS